MNKGVGWYIPKIHVYDNNSRTPIKIGKVSGNFCDEIATDVYGQPIHGRPVRVIAKLLQQEFFRRQALEKGNPEHIPQLFFRWLGIEKMVNDLTGFLWKWACKGYPTEAKENGVSEEK